MEDLFELEVLNNLKHMYSCDSEELVVYIFFLRCMIFHLKVDLDNLEIINFLEKELYLPKSNTIKFNNDTIYKRYYGTSSSIESIIDNWKFSILDSFQIGLNKKKISNKDNLIKEYNEYYKIAEKCLKRFPKKTRYLKEGYKHIMSLSFYKNYEIDYIREPRNIDGLEYDFKQQFYDKLIVDLEYQRYYDSLSLERNEREQRLENFIYDNHKVTTNNLLFDDIRIIHRQFKIDNIVIDLLGKDKLDNIVIIELKVVNKPIDIFYQIRSYTENVKKHFNTNKIRFIAITPKLHNDIYNILKNENIELYYYHKKLDDFSFKKIF